jgi:hypothetical protein
MPAGRPEDPVGVGEGVAVGVAVGVGWGTPTIGVALLVGVDGEDPHRASPRPPATHSATSVNFLAFIPSPPAYKLH